MNREPIGYIQITLMNKERIPTHLMKLSAVRRSHAMIPIALG